jgi:hypothetical protein
MKGTGFLGYKEHGTDIPRQFINPVIAPSYL